MGLEKELKELKSPLIMLSVSVHERLIDSNAYAKCVIMVLHAK